MNPFPVSNSNLSASHLGEFLQTQYNLKGNVTCKILRAGINDTYKLTDANGNYVFRIYSLNWRTRTEIIEELRLLETLKQEGISVSFPIKCKNGNHIQLLHAPEGERMGVLFSYAEGEKIHNYTEEQHFKVGVLMAKLHQITTGMNVDRVSYSSQVLLVDSLNRIKSFLPEDTDEMKWMQSVQAQLTHNFSQVKTDLIRSGVVHMDLWFDNINITKEGHITLFDFDFCGNGWICLDVAFYVMQIAYVERDDTVFQVKKKSFLKGYESITPIHEEEKRILPMLGISMYFFYLGIQCQRYDNWSNAFLSETYLKRYIIGIVKRYYDMNFLGEE